MTRFVNHSIAAVVAVVLTISSIGAIVTVPPASAHGPLAASPAGELA